LFDDALSLVWGGVCVMKLKIHFRAIIWGCMSEEIEVAFWNVCVMKLKLYFRTSVCDEIEVAFSNLLGSGRGWWCVVCVGVGGEECVCGF